MSKTAAMSLGNGSTDVERGLDGKNLPSPKATAEFRNKALHFFFCFIGLQLSYVTWGVMQEMLMTQTYEPGRFQSSAFLVFCNRFLALFISAAIVYYSNSRSNTPLYMYAPSSISNICSSWAQYEALRYVNFPLQVLSKSSKIIPVMLMGVLLQKRSYPMIEYVEALCISLGVFMFTLSQTASNSNLNQNHDYETIVGLLLLCMYIASDSFTSQWQSKVFNMYPVSQYEMMLGNVFLSFIISLVIILVNGELLTSIHFLFVLDSTHLALFHVFLTSLSSAIGQLFIFHTIKQFGPVAFTIIMTIRQMLSMILSCLIFGHDVSSTSSWLGAALVFGMLFNKMRREVGEKRGKSVLVEEKRSNEKD